MKDFDFPKIMSEQYPYDMGPWLCEKSEHGLKALVEIRKDLLKIANNDTIEKDIKDWLNYNLSYTMFQLTKIYAFSNGADWNPADEDILFDKLDNGLEELQVKYGLREKTTEQVETENYADFISKLKEYVEMEQDPGRSLLQGHLDNHTSYIEDHTWNGFFLRKIEKLAYKVANGELDWSDFISQAKKLVSDIDVKS
jgi:hypothetical protein